jgi:hypothetical protein
MSTASFAFRRWRVSPGRTSLLIAGGIAAAIWVGAVGLRSRHAFLYEAAPVLLVPLALWLFFSERYELTLAAFLLFVGILDGPIKDASGSSLATLGRDAVLYAIALGAIARLILRRQRLTVPPFSGFVFAWVAVCVLQLFNPVVHSEVHAIASLRQHLEFVPLFFFGYFVLRSEKRLTILMVLLLIAAAANGVASLIEDAVGPNGVASWGPGYASLVHGTAVQAAALFTAPNGQQSLRPPGLGDAYGFGGFVGVLALPGAFALLSLRRRAGRWGRLMFPALILTIVAIVLSQARLNVVGAVIAFVLFLSLTLRSRRDIATLLITTAVAVIGYVIISDFTASNASRYSSIAPNRVVSTALSARAGTFRQIPQYLVDFPLGAGIGSVGPAGGSSIGGGSEQTTALDAESEVTFLLIETGIPGLAVLLAMTLTMAVIGIRLLRIEDPTLRRLLAALTTAWIVIAIDWTFGAVSANVPDSPFIWLTAGCLAYWYAEMRAGRVRTRPRRVNAALALR